MSYKVAVWAGIFVAILVRSQPTVAQPKDKLTATLVSYADSARRLSDTNHDAEAFRLLTKAFNVRNRHLSPLGTIHLLYQKGVILRKNNRFAESIDSYKSANQIALQLRDSTQLSRISFALSMTYADVGDYVAAITQCHRTLNYLTKSHEPDQQKGVYLLLNELYYRTNNPTLSNHYLNQFIELTRYSPRLDNRMQAENALAEHLARQNNYRQAVFHWQRALRLTSQLPKNEQAIYRKDCLVELAHGLAQLRQWQAALHAVNEALSWDKSYHSVWSLSLAYMEMASIFSAQNKHRQAVTTGKRAVAYARLSHSPNTLLRSLDSLQQFQARAGQYQQAWAISKTVRCLADSLLTVAKTQAIAQVETRYKVAAQATTIQTLQKDVLITRLRDTNRQREVATIKFQRLALVCLLAGLVLVVMLIYRLLVRTRHFQQRTEQQRQLLEDQANKLQAANASKDKLFSIISHDLRSPVASLQYVLAEVQQLSHSSARWSLLVARLTNQINQLSQLINNLLYWSLTQQGLVKNRMDWVPVSSVVAHGQHLYHDVIYQKNLVMQVSGPPTQLWADESQLQVIVRNLIDNAVKFSPIGSTIQIDWTDEPTQYQLVVRNEITTLNEHLHGAHLGLRVVYELVENQGGTVVVDSLKDCFWQVTVRWPLAQPSSLPTYKHST